MMLPARIPEGEDLAVLFEDRQLTYGELHGRARRIAAKLRQMGVGPETPVGLALERSLDLLPAILGIWKAGGAYVPIDPHYPRERREAIVRDAGIDVLVTSELLRDLSDEEAEPVDLRAASLAYIIYTSGSTGQPNGVAVTHGSLWNFIDAVRIEMDVTERDTVLAVGPVSFDISVMELYLPLAAGARLAISSPGQDVHREVARFDPTMMIATPAAWRLLLQSGWQGRADFKAVSAGDVLPRPLANEILTRAGKLWNGYGPTETTAGAAFARVEPGDGPVPIGRAIANVDLFVLDAAQQLCNEGELYIGGAGVARGYWNRPELTALKFLDTAFGRVYRTGDLVRMLPDGQLEFLGRVDDQVKVRGVRIEPGEIETVLARHPGVREIAITTADDRLTAHVVGEIGESDLREFAQAKLPPHLWPSRIVFLDTLPLTANGKLDRKALLHAGREAPRPFAPPRTQVEKFLALIFAEVLDIERIGVNDNFFHLGGQSLLAAQVMSRVWETWKAELPTSVLFESPTVALLAIRIEGWQQPRKNTGIERRANAARYRPSFSQERLWFLQEFHRSALYNLTMFVRLAGELDIDRLQRALNQVVQRHEVLRTNFRIDEAIVNDRSVAIPVVCAQETELIFDLQNDALVNASLVQFAEREYELMICVHHIVFDGWSAGILFRELSALYSGAVLPPLPIQYGDFAEWQRERLTGDVLARQLGYWRDKLSGLKGLLELPTDRPRPAVQSYRGAQFSFELPPELSKSVGEFGRREGATAFMTLLAALQVLLSRYTGDTDICIGTAMAGRARKEIENLIGLFINTLALRTSIPTTASFKDAVSAIRSTVLEAIAHQEVPFERVVEALDPERTVSHTPFFQVMFTQLDLLPQGLELPGVQSGPVQMRTQLSRFDLSLNLDQIDPAIRLTFEYNTDLFDESTICRMSGHVQTLLAAAITDPNGSIATLPLLTEPEREQMLDIWNRTEAPIPSPGTLAGTAADALVDPSIKPGTIVGVALQRSPRLSDVLSSIWNAGATYLPLDPNYPKDRLDFMTEDAGVNVILTDTGLTTLHAALTGTEDLAYIIYTSGSAGRPKGVEIPRSALLNLLEAMRVETGISDQDVFVAVTTLSFDISALELFLPRYASAQLVIATAEEAADGRLLAELLDRSGATMMQATPATWRMLIDAGWRGKPGFKILCGGEAMSRSLADELLDSGGTVWNLFGPTETTIWSTAARVQRGEGPVPIGRPLANTKVYVLDANCELVPIGVAGELYIGGAGLARGYVNQPELTRERFIEVTGFGRLYRTGDLVRWRQDGQLEFIARLDQQVKLRGYRIELGEVEAALVRHPQVRSAAVTCDGEQLLAYYTGGARDLRLFLSQSLPDYMLPADFIQLEALPLTPNGKLDRARLPRHERQLKRERIAPRDELESRLSEIWSEVLKQHSSGVTESFFEVGGHSLQAAQLVARIESSLGKRVSLAALFAAPTIEGIANAIRQTRKPLPEGLAAIQPEGAGRPFFMVEARSMFWRLGQLLGSDRPFFGMHWPSPAMIPEPYRLGDIGAYYVRLIRSQQPRGPYTVGGWCLTAVVAFEIAQQLTASGETVENLFLFDGMNPVEYPRTMISSMSWLRLSTAYHISKLRRMRANEILPYIQERMKTIRASAALRSRRGANLQDSDELKNIVTMVEVAVMNYQPQPYAGRVTYFERGENPPLADDPTHGWGPLMKGEFRPHRIPGKHAEMFQSPNVELMAAKINELLG